MGELRVVATAGHVDHGKSSLIVQLTGIDPDRFEEEKRRGLTIDLGYAWCTLPSGREIGFVDVPGHERFVRNMLAGVGPVRLVMFVVAADERWKPQSEEHLQILDVLGIAGGIIALTKRDLVDEDALSSAAAEVREQVRGTVLEGARIVPVSAHSGEGIDDLRNALDEMVVAAPAPEPTRSRLFIDRVFTIRGAGTVVTGTLGGGCLEAGDDVDLLPTGLRSRIRSLQTHKRVESRSCAVSRVAANLVGVEREGLERGAVLARPDEWRPTMDFEARLRPVRGLAHPVGSRGAYKIHAGAAEADARLRFLGQAKVEPGREAFAHIRVSRPLVLDVFDRFVLRDAGRREIVAGGVVLDVAPPPRTDDGSRLRLTARAAASRDDLPRLLTLERGAVPVREARLLTGSEAADALRVGDWLVREDLSSAVARAVTELLEAYHAERPLEDGAPLATARARVAEALRSANVPSDSGLIDSLLESLTRGGSLVRAASTVRLPSHRVALDPAAEEVQRLVAAIGGENETAPPTIKELIALGVRREVIDAAARSGLVVRVNPELVFAPGFLARAESIVNNAGTAGISVSSFRERLGTSRKYALPILQWFDERGVTRRRGDLRFPRG